VELDPNFALAYSGLSSTYDNTGQPELAAEAARKAFAARERVTEREKLRIAATYYIAATREFDQAIEVLDLMKQTYPRDANPHSSLSLIYFQLGRCEKVMEETREAIRLDPNNTAAPENLAAALLRLNRFDEAKVTLEDIIQRKV